MFVLVSFFAENEPNGSANICFGESAGRKKSILVVAKCLF